ncbi:uncharacterized protein LOC125202369 [Salvia hispanica]|uniref:uncharacterized protein LOC125202369 n=1 Tax=Salvia hispanica TaxID=49212 RepID=UPI0020092780|nr:uncharacterized protein LOC125202369 [Salvia hispanica]
MATHFHPPHSLATAATALRRRNGGSNFFTISEKTLPWRSVHILGNQHSAMSISRIAGFSRVKAANESADSYLDMWKKARERERSSLQFEIMADKTAEDSGEESAEDLEKRSREFEKLLEVPPEERDKVQRMQVIDRAAAAIAATRALIKDSAPPQPETGELDILSGGEEGDLDEGREIASISVPQSSNSTSGTPGPSFWAWAPPLQDDGGEGDDSFGSAKLKPASPFSAPSSPVLEQERSMESLSIPFETEMLQSQNLIPIPPLQSFVEVEKRDVEFSTNATEAAEALSEMNEASNQGVNPDGTRWWKETGIEQRPDGVVCKWTLIRGVSADKSVEWENKYWEAADELAYKELGSEKSGRDAAGNVWREFWRESMMEIDGSVHLEKTAEKWGVNMQGTEWQEKWFEHYGAGQAEKWAHKWCSIDPNTPLEAGHAHVWHERWGEKYDGHGGSTKYTDKWAERFEGDGWAKWGDKWDENFDANSQGVKQGESWWEGKYGDRWNRTWGEGHNGSGWVHKYGKSSCGEHWDTHVQQDTWYERFPHYGFYHCFENSTQLRSVKKPSEWPENS